MDKLPKADSAEVFISYSQDSVEHMERILQLSNRLRSDGVDSLIDQYEVSPPEGWPRWMERSLRDAKYVLLVCTKRYLSRVMGEEREGTGLGVRWEGNLVYQHIYNAGTVNSRFIPLVLRGEDKLFIPTPLQGVTYYCVATDAGYEELYRRLTGQPKVVKPKLGERRSLPPKMVNAAMYVSSPINVDLWNAARWKATLFAFDPQEPPVLGVAFLNEEPARKIFQEWLKLYGPTDVDEVLRVSIIEGAVEGEEPGYSVHIGPDPKGTVKRLKHAGYQVGKEDIHFFVSRINRMNPTPGSNFLELFKKEFKQYGGYFLAPAVISPDFKSMRPLFDLSIYKKQILFRNTSEIGKNDIDSAVLFPPKD